MANEDAKEKGNGAAEEGAGQAEAVEERDEVERLREELSEAEAEAEEYLDGWRRAQAEFSNYKKRQRAEQAKLRELANANLLRKLLPVLDDFDRALATMPEGIRHLSWSDGLFMVEQKLEGILETEGVERIDTEGKRFDPNVHEAVTHEVMPGYEEGEIIGEVQKGYILGDRVLRPALVRVAKTPPVSEDEEAGESKEEKE